MFGISSRHIKEFTTKSLSVPSRTAHSFSLPKISIITPSYNQATFLEKTIYSVINQGYPNSKLIIIDGGSTDGSVEIIKKHEKHLAYWVSEKDNGQSHALNKGIKVASGEWIGWQNSDDIYLPGAFSRLAELAQKYPEVEVFYGNQLCIDESERILRRQFYMHPNLFVYKNTGMTICNQSAFFKRSLITKVGNLDERLNYAMDHEFFLRLILRKIPMKHDRKLWGALRYHGCSKSRGDNEGKWNEEKKYIYNEYSMDWGKSLYKNVGAKVQRLFFLIYANKLDIPREAVKRLMGHYRR